MFGNNRPRIGQELLDVPMGDMIRQMAFAIAEAQIVLDKNSIDVAEMMGGLTTVTDDAGNITYEDSRVYFGNAKMNLLIRIYNWRISYLQMIIFLALADIIACFHFLRIHADLTGAFGFMAENLYFLATSMVFGSNASASSWEPFRKAIQSLITVNLMRPDLISKHKTLLDMLVWDDDDTRSELVQAVKCQINPGILDQDSPLEAYIYVDDILASAVGRQMMLRLLAAIIEAIFTICGRAMIERHQCLPSRSGMNW